MQRLHWYKFYVLRMSYVENVEVITDAWLTWVKTPSPVNCGFVVPIVVSRIHWKCNHRCLIHTELNYLCIRPLRFRFWRTWHTTFGTRSLQFSLDEFSTQVSHASVITSKKFLCSLYIIHRLCTQSKRCFSIRKKTETNKNLPGRWEPITPLSANQISQTPQGPHFLTDQKQSHMFKIEKIPTVVHIFHFHYWSK